MVEYSELWVPRLQAGFRHSTRESFLIRLKHGSTLKAMLRNLHFPMTIC